MPNKGMISEKHKTMIKEISLVFAPKQISIYLQCDSLTVKTWLHHTDRSPRELYHAGIEKLHEAMKAQIDKAPRTVGIKTRTGDIVTLPHVFLL